MNRFNLMELGKAHLDAQARDFAGKNGGADEASWDALITNPAFVQLRANQRAAEALIADEKMKLLNPRIQDGIELLNAEDMALMSVGGLAARITEAMKVVDGVLLEIERRMGYDEEERVKSPYWQTHRRMQDAGMKILVNAVQMVKDVAKK